MLRFALSFALAAAGASQALAAPPGKDKSTGNVVALPVVALVNGEAVPTERLARDLIDLHGAAQLELIITRVIAEQECKKAGVVVADEEVEADIENYMKGLRLKRNEFADICRKQGTTIEHYKRYHVWPKIALVKLVKDSVKVTDDELKMGFEANYGEKVECRMLVVQEQRKAQELWEQVNSQPAAQRSTKFEQLCKVHSVDTASQALGGRVAPFNRHMGEKTLETMVFALQPGELSSIQPIPGGGHAIFLCERRVPPAPGVTIDSPVRPGAKETVRDQLRSGIYGKKLEEEAKRRFLVARDKAKIENFLNGDFNPDALKNVALPASQEPVRK